MQKKYVKTPQSSGRELSFLSLPPGFCAQSQPAASVGSSAAAPVSGSPAGRSLFRAPDRQLVPRHQERKNNMNTNMMKSGFVL